MYCPKISYKTIVTPTKAGVQLQSVWIPAFAGMTNRYPAAIDKNFWEIVFGA